MDDQYEFFLKETKTGNFTCGCSRDKSVFWLHSTYNPLAEAERWVKSHLSNLQDYEQVIVYGLGCGYHIRELLKQTEYKKNITVWEWNKELFEFVKEKGLIEDILNNGRVSLMVSNDRDYIIEQWKGIDGKKSYLIVYTPALKLIPPYLEDLKVLLQMYHINCSTFLVAEEQLNNNFVCNFNSCKIDSKNLLRDIMKGLPGILVSAGPSLSASLPALKKYRDKVFVGAVGTALMPLVKKGIIPDLVMITDPSLKVGEQFLGVDSEILSSIPLFYFGTVAPEVVNLYPGPKIMLLQEGFKKAEETASRFNVEVIETGGSVATALLDFMVKLGLNPICFIGQDLAYTDNRTHNPDTHNYMEFTNRLSDKLLEVDNYFKNGKVKTSMSLYIYKRWIENYIRKSHKVRFFNATQGGAYIEGCEHVTLPEFIERIFHNWDVSNRREYFKKVVYDVYYNESDSK